MAASVVLNLDLQVGIPTRSSHQRCSIKKVSLEIWDSSQECQNLFFKKVANFMKKETLARVFSCEFCEISKSTFFTEHILTTTSDQTKFLM